MHTIDLKFQRIFVGLVKSCFLYCIFGTELEIVIVVKQVALEDRSHDSCLLMS